MNAAALFGLLFQFITFLWTVEIWDSDVEKYLLNLSEDNLWITQGGCYCFHPCNILICLSFCYSQYFLWQYLPRHILVEGGKLELCIRLVLVLQLARIESSNRCTNPATGNGKPTKLKDAHGFQKTFISRRIWGSSPFAFFRKLLSFNRIHFLSPLLIQSSGTMIWDGWIENKWIH